MDEAACDTGERTEHYSGNRRASLFDPRQWADRPRKGHAAQYGGHHGHRNDNLNSSASPQRPLEDTEPIDGNKRIYDTDYSDSDRKCGAELKRVTHLCSQLTTELSG